MSWQSKTIVTCLSGALIMPGTLYLTNHFPTKASILLSGIMTASFGAMLGIQAQKQYTENTEDAEK